MNKALSILSFFGILLITACGGGSGSTAANNSNGEGNTNTVYTVSGMVSGLSGTLVLRNNGGDNLLITSNGSFTFSTAHADSASYNVTVSSQPSGQTCSVTNGNGTISGANVTNVSITCTTTGGGGGATYNVGGSVSGLTGTLVLQNKGGNSLTVTANGSFTFSTALADGSGYNVTVSTQPSGQACTVSNSSGTISGANVTNVIVTCSTITTYTVGGSVSGLTGTLVLQNKGGNSLTVTANGSFTFSAALADGSGYNVTVSIQPSGQACTVSNSSGIISGANVTNVTVICSNSTPTYNLGIKGTINVVEDYSGDVRYFGEVVNTGTGIASFVKITFTTYDSNNNVIGSDYSYVNGNLYISNSTGISFETSLGPNEYGSFEVITNVSYNSAASYSFEITYSTYSASPPTILLAVTGNISVMTDFLGDIEFLGEIINNGGGTASFVRIDFTMKNSSGLVIGTSFNYISGSTCLLSSGTTTDTCLAPYEKGSFDIWTVTPAADVWSYYYRIYHSEYAVAKPGLEKTSYYDNFNDLTHDEKIDMRNKIIDDQVQVFRSSKK